MAIKIIQHKQTPKELAYHFKCGCGCEFWSDSEGVGYFIWTIGEGIYRQCNPIEWTATVEELEPGIYGYTSTTVSNIPSENYEMLTVLCNGTYMNIKGHVQIVYDSNTPYIEYKSTSIVNADSVIIHAQKGQIKNNGVGTVR